ncbi:MAG: acetyl-CoA carboxylase carboxyl transferase subunit alpha [Verrucomicrobia bacterium]|nr:MAG: acetyl-CoA carboxylase carboxyl transferase subunit alpha [Verrucomicrobiota bacterium]PYK47963.1 MAG: acetyl-CoA carboxylase carboxyl transferase subunit alpha [Verrucomicrobiota bacterium]PYL42302.1 MAG: acetyl-CoA carboxylase carboxyl transferase subunit alpha [Verrucomicrobiota bacterium]
MDWQPLDFERSIFELDRRLEDLKNHSDKHDVDLDPAIKDLEAKLRETRRSVYGNLTAWQRVQIARHTQRPFALDYVDRCFTNWVELHGDRRFADDRAMPCGLALLDGQRCVVITHQKGRNTKENVMRNFGCAHPEGYRKALRLMRLGEKFGMPVISLIDTPGAFPGVGSEERHISEAIAVNLREMMRLRAPIVAAVIGEGGSGGALGIGVADHVLILENAYYSVISPEACSAILWRDRRHAAEAAEALKLTAQDLLKLEVVDEIVPEPEGGAHRDYDSVAANVGRALRRALQQVSRVPIAELLEKRYQKFRRLGVFSEGKTVTASARS